MRIFRVRIVQIHDANVILYRICDEAVSRFLTRYEMMLPTRIARMFLDKSATIPYLDYEPDKVCKQVLNQCAMILPRRIASYTSEKVQQCTQAGM